MVTRKFMKGLLLGIGCASLLASTFAFASVEPAKPDAVNKKAILQKAVRPKIPFDANQDPLKESQAAGTYAALIADGDGWREVGKLTFGKLLRERTIDLSAFWRNGEPVRIRLVQEGGGAAHIDAIAVGGNPPLQVSGVSDPNAINKLQRRDFDLLDAFQKTLDISFPSNASEKSLKLTARVEPEQISKTPFQFPSANLFKEIDETARFYSYILNSSKPDESRVNIRRIWRTSLFSRSTAGLAQGILPDSPMVG